MDIRLSLVLLLLSLALVAELSSSSSLGDAYWVVGGSRPKCNGLVGDCIGESNEMMMDSEVARRGLYNRRRRYISYEALKANRIPCSRPGQSYYNCRKNVRVNPYRRSCTMATHCARDLR